MKALKITAYGKVEENLAIQECAIPEMKSTDVLIEVHYASINPIDYKTIKGATRIINTLKFPAPIGFDVSGVVLEVGDEVKQYKIGDEVFARVGGDRPGTIAEFIAVDAQFLAPKPKNVSFQDAASVPLTGLTTVQAFQMANLKAGQSVLIHAGSGGIGTFAIQYAKYLGAFVYTTTSTANVDWVKKLGADVVIDYKKENYLDIVPEVDFVYDTIGGKFTLPSFKILKKGGMVINLSGPVIDPVSFRELKISKWLKPIIGIMYLPVLRMMKRKDARYRFFLMEPNGQQLQDIAQLMEKGVIKAVIDSEFPFEKSIEALKHLEKGRSKGKIVIRLKA